MDSIRTHVFALHPEEQQRAATAPSCWLLSPQEGAQASLSSFYLKELPSLRGSPRLLSGAVKHGVQQ